MSILSDREIKAFMHSGQISIEPFIEERLTPNGYDLSIAELLIPAQGLRIVSDKARIPPLTWFLVGTLEKISLGAKVSAQLWIKSSWARRGVLGSFGKVDAGFQGTLTLSALNASQNPLEITIGDPFVQIVFETLISEAELTYEKRSGRYQGQMGIKL
ncbi:MAG: dCTP deaminase [Candidatus Bathyarchaeia archaeon]